MISSWATTVVSSVTTSASRATSEPSASTSLPGGTRRKIAAIGTTRNVSVAIVAATSAMGNSRLMPAARSRPPAAPSGRRAEERDQERLGRGEVTGFAAIAAS